MRRITLAERLRKIPLSFFGKNLADLTSAIMADCIFLEQSFSHFIPELAGSIISTVLISIGLLAFDWRMALAAVKRRFPGWRRGFGMRTVAGSDKIVVLSEGTVAEEGAPEKWMKQNGLYARMVNLQTESQSWKLT